MINEQTERCHTDGVNFLRASEKVEIDKLVFILKRNIMKKKYQIMSISLVILFVFAACDKPTPNEKFYYLSGYNPYFGYTEHGDDYAHSSGYYIISNDLKDTFLTFNLPNHLFSIPTEAFQTGEDCGYSFSQKYRFAFSFEMNYEMTPEDECRNIRYPANIYLYPKYISIPQINIISIKIK